MKRAALLVLLLFPLGGCFDMMCTTELRWGLRVSVTGADTGQPVAATVVARDGDYVEELEQVGTYHVGAGERPGTYRIDIMAEGYAPRTIDDVEVDEDGCHVDTAERSVALDPL
jgi:hypothetical protein